MLDTIIWKDAETPIIEINLNKVSGQFVENIFQKNANNTYSETLIGSILVEQSRDAQSTETTNRANRADRATYSARSESATRAIVARMGAETIYDKTISTQVDFDNLINSATWLGATTVAIDGQFVVSGKRISIPNNVVSIIGTDGSSITGANIKDGAFLSYQNMRRFTTIENLNIGIVSANDNVNLIALKNFANVKNMDISLELSKGQGVVLDGCYNIEGVVGSIIKDGEEDLSLSVMSVFKNCTNIESSGGVVGDGLNGHIFLESNNIINCSGAVENGTVFEKCDRISGSIALVEDTDIIGFNECSQIINCEATNDGYGYVGCEQGSNNIGKANECYYWSTITNEYISDGSLDPVFGNNTPAQIAQAVSEEIVPLSWDIGSIKRITLTNGTVVDVRIADKQVGRYDKVGGGKTNIVLEFTMCMPTTAQMNATSTNTGGWEASKMRTVTMAQIFNLLPQEWKDIIPTVLVPTTNEWLEQGAMTFVYSQDKLFLPSDFEIFRSYEYELMGKTVFDYYSPSRYGYDTQALRFRRRKGDSWWLRTPDVYNIANFCCVTSTGDVSAFPAMTNFGVSPCFAL